MPYQKNNSKNFSYYITKEEENQRLDRWIQRKFPTFAHHAISCAIRKRDIRVHDKRTFAHVILRAGHQVSIYAPLLKNLPEPKKRSSSTHLNPWQRTKRADLLRDLHANAIAVTPEFYVFNKPYGLAAQDGTDQLFSVDSLLRWESQEKGKPPPFIVHRLDRLTTGLLLVARTRASAASLSALFREAKIEKTYIACTVGDAPFLKNSEKGSQKPMLWRHFLKKKAGHHAGKIKICEPDTPEAREALTHVHTLKTETRGKHTLTWLLLRPKTGRMHQLRVQCAASGLPILGDGLYGGKSAYPWGRARQTPLHLHAYKLRFVHPITQHSVTYTAPLPEVMENLSD